MSGKDYFSDYLTEAQDLGASFNSPAFLAARSNGYSVTATTTGSPNGTFKLQVSNAKTWNSSEIPSGSWVDVVDSDQAIVAAGNITWDVETKCKWVRVVYTRTSGSGSCDVVAFYRIKY